MNRIINDIDIFKLIQKEHISNEDYQVLFMLYQPIIGVEAINLYLTLVQEKKLTARINLDFTHGRLKTLLKISTTQLILALQQQEAVKLINTYYYSLKSTYIYELFSPLKANDFFVHSSLNNQLLTQIGKNNYERQKFYFLKNDIEITENYVNISQSENSIPPTLQLQNTLNNIYSTEKKSYSNPYYSFTNQQQPSMKVNLNVAQTKLVAKNNVKDINNTLALMQNKSPEEYLITLTNQAPTIKLQQILTTLTNDFHLNNAIINCLLEYVWFKNNKRLEPNYIIKIAKTFQEHNINTIDSALNHLKLAYAHSKKNPYQKFEQESLWSTPTAVTPTNFNKTFSSKQQTINLLNNKTLTQEEINSILKEFDAH